VSEASYRGYVWGGIRRLDASLRAQWRGAVASKVECHGARPRQKVGARHARLRRASCAWLRSRRQEAALLTRPARRSLLRVSGRRASQIARASRGFDLPAARRTKGCSQARRLSRRNFQDCGSQRLLSFVLCPLFDPPEAWSNLLGRPSSRPLQKATESGAVKPRPKAAAKRRGATRRRSRAWRARLTVYSRAPWHQP
jgi:hypothetical protein